MEHVFAIALKDFQQYLKNIQMYIFMFIMPIGFTLLFGAVFADAGSTSPIHWTIAVINQDQGTSGALWLDELSKDSNVILDQVEQQGESELISRIQADEYTAALVIPIDFSQQLSQGKTPLIQVYSEGSGDVHALLLNAFQSAALLPTTFHQQANAAAAIYEAQTGKESSTFREMIFNKMVATRKEPVIKMEKLSAVPFNSYTQSAPGMILQFAISGMIGIAAILVEEKTSRTFARIRSTGTSSLSYLVGHGLSFLCLLVIQFSILILFGQFFLDLAYFSAPLSTLLVVGSIILCFTAMGLLLGVLAKNTGQSIIFSLLAMFLFSALGGAWVPLEIMSPGMQFAGKFSPVSWGMMGFKDILLNSASVSEILHPVFMLGIFTLVFMAAAVLLYQWQKEKS